MYPNMKFPCKNIRNAKYGAYFGEFLSGHFPMLPCCQKEYKKASQMMVDGVNGVPTNPYAAMPQLSGLAEVIVDSGRKATPHQATVGDV